MLDEIRGCTQLLTLRSLKMASNRSSGEGARDLVIDNLLCADMLTAEVYS